MNDIENFRKYLHDHKVLFVTNGDLFRKSLVLKSYNLYKDLVYDDNFICFPTRLTYRIDYKLNQAKVIDMDSKGIQYGNDVFIKMLEYAMYKYNYVIYLDNDMFVININNLFEMIKYVIENDIDIVYPINQAYPNINYNLDDEYCNINKKYICNTFFHIINVKKLFPYISQDFIKFELVPQLFRQNYFNEPYNEFYYNIIKNSEKIHILDCAYLWNEDHDFCGTCVFNQNKDIIGIHTYYSRIYDDVQSRWKELILANESHFNNIATYIDIIYNFVSKNQESNNNVLDIFPYKYYFKESLDNKILLCNEIYEKYMDHSLKLNEYTITNN